MNRVALAAASALSLAYGARAAAQTPLAVPERYSFYLTLGTDTILTERVWRTPAELNGEFLDHRRGARLEYLATLNADASIRTLAAHTYRSPADSGEIATFQIDSAEVVAQLGNGQRGRIPGAAGLMPVINPSIAFIEQIMLRVKTMHGGDRTTVPILMIGQSQPITASVTMSGDSAVIEYANVTMHLALSADGHVMGGAVPAQRIAISRGPAGAPLVATRKDYSAPAGAPYTAEDVIVRTPAGLRLSGTLTLPSPRRGRVAAAVTVTGSGAEDRDEQSPMYPAYRPFRQLADTLGRRGIAVLRLDDRGVGESDAGPASVTSADFADDIRAAIAYLRARPEIDTARIALVGHSEGGVIAPMIAETDRQIRGLVLMAATASPGRAILSSQQHYIVDTVAKLAGARRDSVLARYARATDSVAAALPWMQWFLAHDPSIVALGVRTPVLILQGEADHQVPSSEAEKLAAAFRRGGNRRVTVRVFPETNHLFVTDTIGGFSYEKLPSLAVRKDVLGAIADWLSETLR
jgi:alpha-beta hydrolase superfamily lysophospholipase